MLFYNDQLHYAASVQGSQNKLFSCLHMPVKVVDVDF